MAKIVVSHAEDPALAVILTEVFPGEPGKAQGYHGRCTECSKTMHRWHKDKAVRSAERHVASHEATVIGADPFNLIR